MNYEVRKQNGAFLVVSGEAAVGVIEWNTTEEVVAIFDDSNIGYFPATDSGIDEAARLIVSYYEAFGL